jgi:hypothetical protein
MAHQDIRAFRPTVVELTPFVQTHLTNGRLSKLEDLADEADDASLQLCKSDDELEAAIAALPRREKPAPKSAKK